MDKKSLMRKIIIKTVPKSKIRNKGVGDYVRLGGGLEIRVAQMGDKEAETSIAVHELIEALLVDKRKISFRKITAFDKKNVGKPGEPGEMSGAPYKKEHAVANVVEKIMEKELKKKVRKQK